jgi:hypothetical protein
LIPSARDCPQSSPELLRDEDVDGGPIAGLAPWTVPSAVFGPAAALDLLLSLPQSPPTRLGIGASVRVLADVAKLGIELVARGRMLPAVEQRGDAWVARWRPAPDDADDTARLRLLSAALPPAGRAERTGSPDGQDPGAVVHDALGSLVDALVRESLDQRAFVPARRGRPPNVVPVGEVWRAALSCPDSVVGADPAELELLQKALEEWAHPARAAAERGFRTCFRLSEPGRGPGAPWRLDFMLQALDDLSLLVPADVVWSTTGGRLSAFKRTIDDPQEALLEDLGRAARLCPQLDPALDVATPTGTDLDATGAHRFLRDGASLLEQAGFGILVPPWWKGRDAALKARLRVARKDGGATVSSGMFGLDGLCEYDWRIAVGGEELTARELKEIAALKVPLVNVRGKWVELRSGDVEAALALLERGPSETTISDVLRAGLGLEPEMLGLEVERIEADGALGDLLAADADARISPTRTPAGFVGKLRPYQERGLSWLAFLGELGLGACLADDMGTGKTPTVLALLIAERAVPQPRGRRLGPTLVICPMSVAGNWQREAKRFAPELGTLVHHGTERLRGPAFARAANASDLVITTYALAARDRDALSSVAWRRVVLDEAQNIKNGSAKQARAARALKANQRVALTGTPVENRLSELWSIMEFLNPGLLGSAKSFRERFAVPIERYRDETAAESLKRVTGPFVLRRVKTDKRIIKDLPDKIEMKVLCNLTREQASLYQSVVDDMLEQIERTEGIQRKGLVLSTIMKLKQVCNHPAQMLKDNSRLGGRSGKLVRLEEIVEEVLAEDDKALCFTQFAEWGRVLKPHLQQRFGREVLFLHGGTTKKARDTMVERFQDEASGPPLMLISLKAGGTGLNLTAATHVIHFDRWWNPAVEDQATDRAFRIGQTRHVQVRKFVCGGTLEERIDRLIESKKDLASRIVGSGESWLTELSTEQLKEIVMLASDTVGS